MQRKIKFRAWDDHYKYMNYKVLVGVYGNWEEVKDDEDYTACSMWIDPKNVDYKCEPHWSHFEPYHKDIKLMQYTGLKDKNGKEIYEGDILSCNKNNETYIVQIENMMEEIFIEDSYYHLDKNVIKWWNIKVIGNIYDNPELIEAEE